MRKRRIVQKGLSFLWGFLAVTGALTLTFTLLIVPAGCLGCMFLNRVLVQHNTTGPFDHISISEDELLGTWKLREEEVLGTTGFVSLLGSQFTVNEGNTVVPHKEGVVPREFYYSNQSHYFGSLIGFKYTKNSDTHFAFFEVIRESGEILLVKHPDQLMQGYPYSYAKLRNGKQEMEPSLLPLPNPPTE